MKLLEQLVTWTGSVLDDVEFIQVSSATFHRDFGPWVEGEFANLLELNYLKGELIEYSGMEIVKSVKVKLEVK